MAAKPSRLAGTHTCTMVAPQPATYHDQRFGMQQLSFVSLGRPRVPTACSCAACHRSSDVLPVTGSTSLDLTVTKVLLLFEGSQPEVVTRRYFHCKAVLLYYVGVCRGFSMILPAHTPTRSTSLSTQSRTLAGSWGPGGNEVCSDCLDGRKVLLNGSMSVGSDNRQHAEII